MITNEEIAEQKLSETAFAALLRGFGATRLLDVGASHGLFASVIRHFGYTGMIYSVEPQPDCRRQMTRSGLGDLRWIVLPSQGAGAEDSVMTLNVSENSVSSSFLAPHANHLQTEPTVRTVGTRQAYVSATRSLLQPNVTAAIDALKVDTQGYELNVMKGLGSSFGGLKIILTELSSIPCYEGGPSLEDVDDYIVNQMGFARVSLTPAYVDEASGVIQQYDGVYVRRDLLAKAQEILANRDAAPLAEANRGLGQDGGAGQGLAAVVVSLPGKAPKRPDAQDRDFGQSWLESCGKSWGSYSPRVLSVSEAQSILPGVKWRKVSQKPAIRDIFATLAQAPPGGEGFVLLTNADILLGPQLRDLLPQMDPNVLYYCSRLDVRINARDPRVLEPDGVYHMGYDAFFLPQELISRIHRRGLIPGEFRIGKPWWDYVVPIAALLAGYPTKKFLAEPHPILHMSHVITSNAWLEENGKIFVAWLRSLLKLPASPMTGMLAEFIEGYDSIEGDHRSKLRGLGARVIPGLT